MKKLLILMLLMASCKHEPIPDSPRLEGLWVRLLPQEPSWQYHFCDGTLTQMVITLGDTSVILKYPYTQREHIMHIGDTPDNQRLWSLSFINDTTCQAKDITPGNIIAHTLLLGKKK